jgi:dipeptidyl aminopeptidase/acylaminoacyl peptidase
MSDGLKVIAYLYKQKKKFNKKHPTIIFNRGSYIRGDIAPELVSMFHRLAEKGFVILAPMYRQSDGGEGRDRLGGEDINDLMNTLPLVRNLKFIDTNNLFMYGESRGGMMTYQAIKKGFSINASAVYGAFTDMEDMIKSRPDVYTAQVGKGIFGDDYESKKEEIFRTSVNPNQSLRFAQKLLEANKVFELVIYAEDNHVLSANKINRDEKTVEWFKKYLKK